MPKHEKQMLRKVMTVTQKDYIPQDVFAGDAPPQQSPRVMIAPARYIQGDGVLDHLGRYLSLVHSTSPALLITEGGLKRVGDRVLQSLQQVQIEPFTLIFEGECSDEEVERHVKKLRGNAADALIAIGGG
jgi:glycerol dehydrogenase